MTVSGNFIALRLIMMLMAASDLINEELLFCILSAQVWLYVAGTV